MVYVKLKIKYMEQVDGCKWKFKKNHCHYYQVQAQMNVCSIENADFFVQTQKNTITRDKDSFNN